MTRGALGVIGGITGDAAGLGVGLAVGAQIGLRAGIARRPRPMPHQMAGWLDHRGGWPIVHPISCWRGWGCMRA